MINEMNYNNFFQLMYKENEDIYIFDSPDMYNAYIALLHNELTSLEKINKSFIEYEGGKISSITLDMENDNEYLEVFMEKKECFIEVKIFIDKDEDTNASFEIYRHYGSHNVLIAQKKGGSFFSKSIKGYTKDKALESSILNKYKDIRQRNMEDWKEIVLSKSKDDRITKLMDSVYFLDTEVIQKQVTRLDISLWHLFIWMKKECT